MKVYYSKGWAVTFVVAGMVLIILNFILFNLTGKLEWYRNVPGIMVMVVGILYFFQPYFEVREKELVTFSLLGFTAWRYSINSISDLILEEKKLYRMKNGKMKRIRVSAFVCNKEDWKKFVMLIEGHEPGSELHD